MGIKSTLKGLALLATTVNAQIATYTKDDHSISVNIPSGTASSGSGPIFFQISAPSGTQWTAFGQGNRMAGANIFILYAADSNNVTISGRSGQGHIMPEHDSSIRLTLLEGSGISNGAMIANVRCDNCQSWSGGSMSMTNSRSSWIHAYKSGSALNSQDPNETIQQHDGDYTFSLDLTSGTGGSSQNPFVQAQASASSGSSPSQTGTSPSATRSVSAPIASSPGSNTGASGTTSTDNSSTLTLAHGVIMSLLFIGLFPIFSLTLYLPTAKKVRFIHGPLQIFSVVLLIVGMALGIVLGMRINELDGYHMVIGFIVVAVMVLFQPALGIYQHLHYSRTGTRSTFGMVHRWLGRSMIALGIVNGGLGLLTAGNTGGYIPYAVVAAIMAVLYIGFVAFMTFRGKSSTDVNNEKGAGYEMQPKKESKHRRLDSEPSSPNGAYAAQQKTTQPTVNRI